MSSISAETILQPQATETSQGMDLVEKAEHLSRAMAMKAVLGPHLDAMMRPMYEDELTAEEADRLPSLEGDFPLRVLEHFYRRVQSLLQNRFNASIRDGEAYSRLLNLNASRPDLLFYHGYPLDSIKESIGTSVAAPLRVASWISGIERLSEPGGYPVRTVDELTEIMGRESFQRVLLRLTKGPNEFLGSGSDEFQADIGIRFYGFKNGANPLLVEDAFDVQNGKVVGLSDDYVLAAEQRRKELRARAASGGITHKGADSSGCPVRHSFDDVSGTPQEPLVVTGAGFVKRALRRAEQIPYRPSVT